MGETKSTSLLLDLDLWEEFKAIAKDEGRSATKQLERELRAAIQRHKAAKKLQEGAEHSASLPSPSARDVTPPSSNLTGLRVVTLDTSSDVRTHFGEDLPRAAEEDSEPYRGGKK